MPATKSLLLSSALSFASLVQAWGTLGHETVALIAQNYVTADTVSFVQNILNSTSDTYMADVATWADSYRYTSAGRFSEPYHFIDAEDNPPTTCNVDYSRDCGSKGCSVSAIANYTSRLQDNSLSASEQLDAMKFIIHIIGDVHQPLHDEALEVGGNDISVKFGTTKTNLHHIWDTNMPEKLVGGSTLSDAQTWAASLIGDIENGTFSGESSSWLTGVSLSDPVTTAMGWASDANAFVCSVVLPNGASAYTNKNLAGAYYDSAISTIELQVAKAGYRLAAWLNLIASGSNNLEVSRLRARNTGPASWMPPAGNDLSRAKMARAASVHKC